MKSEFMTARFGKKNSRTSNCKAYTTLWRLKQFPAREIIVDFSVLTESIPSVKIV